jgi:hypothetical protein
MPTRNAVSIGSWYNYDILWWQKVCTIALSWTFQLSWKYQLLSHRGGTNLKEVVRISPSHLWID